MPDIDFSDPRKVLRWAREEIGKFEAAEKTFFDAHPGKRYAVLDYRAGHIVHGIRFTEQLGDDLERSAYRTVGDLRNSLDQAVHAAAKALGTKQPNRTNFPIRQSEKDFWRTLGAKNNLHSGIPNQLHPILGSFEPFPQEEGAANGNDILCALGSMANPNKHQVPLGVNAQTGMRLYGMRGGVVSIGTLWDGKGHTELYRTIPGVPHEVNMELEPRIALGLSVPTLGGKPAVRAFNDLYVVVEGVVSSLEAEAAQILGK